MAALDFDKAFALPAIGHAGRRCSARIILLCVLASSTPIRAAEPISPRRLLEVVDISGPVVSPDGTKVAFRTEQASVARNTYDTVWYVETMDARSPPLRVGEGGIPLRNPAGVVTPASALWSPDGKWIYYRALIDGRDDVWRAHADGSGAEPLTLDPANVRQFSLTPDGKTLKYSVGASRDEIASAELAEYNRGIHVDETVPIGHGGLFRSGYVEGRLATQRLKYWYDRVPLLADVPDRWKAIDLTTGQRRDLAPSEVPPSGSAPVLPKGAPDAWKVAVDPRNGRTGLLIRTGELGDLVQKPNVEMAVMFGTRSKQLVTCKAELCAGKSISNIQWRPGSDELLYTVSDEGWADSIYAWNVRTGQVRPIVRSSGLLNDGERYGLENNGCGLSSTALACVAAEANQPPRLERIDLETGDRQLLFDPNPSLRKDMAATVPVNTLHWRGLGGHLFTGQFFSARRKGSAPAPLFVTYYRCLGFLRGGFGGDWPLATLASEGISTLCINHAPLRYNAVKRYNEGLSAVESAVNMLASEGEIDRTKVGMGGLSFGTEITMWTAFNSDLLAAISITSAMWSRSMFLDGTIQGDKFFKTMRKVWQLGSFDETPRQWKRIGLEFNLDKIKAPVLMQMPEQEYGWMLDSTVPLIRAKKADLYVFPNSPHFKFEPDQLLAANQRNVDWFRFWLQGYEDPNPSKATQYKIWREMQTARLKQPRPEK
jgi:dipeptidyl aminopeptidase/acylaminoacyl peptidase